MPSNWNRSALALVVPAACLGAGGPTSAIAATAGAAATAGSGTTPARAELQDLACQRAADPGGRAVAVTAVMRPVSGTERMAVKFDLERRTGRAGPFVRISGHGLDKWEYPTDPSTLGQLPGDVWMLKHNVVNLAGPAHYRFRVSFRWTGQNVRQLTEATRVSALCFQPEPRADLQVRSLTITPITAQEYRYVAVIRNGGATAAGGFTVALRSDGVTLQTEPVQSLAPQATTRVSFSAPACTAGSTIAVVADPDRAVDDFNHWNNRAAVPCPAPAAP